MTLFLAIDGGNSKTEVLLADTAGTVLGYARGIGSNHQTAGGMSEAMSRLDQLVRAASAQVEVVERPALASVYLAGADLPVELVALTDAINAAGWAEKSIVDNDTFALLRAGTESPDAVAIVCGAGTNCVARAADGRTVRFPSLGQITGDWGGVLRARDPLLFGVITERLLSAAPHAEISLVTDPPVVGAALLGLDALGIDGPAHETLRTEVRRLLATGEPE